MSDLICSDGMLLNTVMLVARVIQSGAEASWHCRKHVTYRVSSDFCATLYNADIQNSSRVLRSPQIFNPDKRVLSRNWPQPIRCTSFPIHDLLMRTNNAVRSIIRSIKDAERSHASHSQHRIPSMTWSRLLSFYVRRHAELRLLHA
jgi:hypothetical protein